MRSARSQRADRTLQARCSLGGSVSSCRGQGRSPLPLRVRGKVGRFGGRGRRGIRVRGGPAGGNPGFEGGNRKPTRSAESYNRDFAASGELVKPMPTDTAELVAYLSCRQQAGEVLRGGSRHGLSPCVQVGARKQKTPDALRVGLLARVRRPYGGRPDQLKPDRFRRGSRGRLSTCPPAATSGRPCGGPTITAMYQTTTFLPSGQVDQRPVTSRRRRTALGGSGASKTNGR